MFLLVAMKLEEKDKKPHLCTMYVAELYKGTGTEDSWILKRCPELLGTFRVEDVAQLITNSSDKNVIDLGGSLPLSIELDTYRWLRATKEDDLITVRGIKRIKFWVLFATGLHVRMTCCLTLPSAILKLNEESKRFRVDMVYVVREERLDEGR